MSNVSFSGIGGLDGFKGGNIGLDVSFGKFIPDGLAMKPLPVKSFTGLGPGLPGPSAADFFGSGNTLDMSRFKSLTIEGQKDLQSVAQIYLNNLAGDVHRSAWLRTSERITDNGEHLMDRLLKQGDQETIKAYSKMAGFDLASVKIAKDILKATVDTNADPGPPVKNFKGSFENYTQMNKQIAKSFARGDNPQNVALERMPGFVREFGQIDALGATKFADLSQLTPGERLGVYRPGSPGNTAAWHEFRDAAKVSLATAFVAGSNGQISRAEADGIVANNWHSHFKASVRGAFDEKVGAAAAQALRLPAGASVIGDTISFASGDRVALKDLQELRDLMPGLSSTQQKEVRALVREKFGSGLGLGTAGPAALTDAPVDGQVQIVLQKIGAMKPVSSAEKGFFGEAEPNLRVTDSAVVDSRGTVSDSASRYRTTLRGGVQLGVSQAGDMFSSVMITGLRVAGQQSTYVVVIQRVGGAAAIDVPGLIERVQGLGVTSPVAGAGVYVSDIPIPTQREGALSLTRSYRGTEDNGNSGTPEGQTQLVESDVRITVYTSQYWRYVQELQSYNALGLDARGGVPTRYPGVPTEDIGSVRLQPLVDPRGPAPFQGGGR